jgi:hypothetical protein
VSGESASKGDEHDSGDNHDNEEAVEHRARPRGQRSVAPAQSMGIPRPGLGPFTYGPGSRTTSTRRRHCVGMASSVRNASRQDEGGGSSRLREQPSLPKELAPNCGALVSQSHRVSDLPIPNEFVRDRDRRRLVVPNCNATVM